jgi:hypothetical protein
VETAGVAPIPSYPRLERTSPDARRGSGQAFDRALRDQRDPAPPRAPEDQASGPVAADLQAHAPRSRKSQHAGEHRVDIVV